MILNIWTQDRKNTQEKIKAPINNNILTRCK